MYKNKYIKGGKEGLFVVVEGQLLYVCVCVKIYIFIC